MCDARRASVCHLFDYVLELKAFYHICNVNADSFVGISICWLVNGTEQTLHRNNEVSTLLRLNVSFCESKMEKIKIVLEYWWWKSILLPELNTRPQLIFFLLIFGFFEVMWHGTWLTEILANETETSAFIKIHSAKCVVLLSAKKNPNHTARYSACSILYSISGSFISRFFILLLSLNHRAHTVHALCSPRRVWGTRDKMGHQSHWSLTAKTDVEWNIVTNQ